MNETPPPENSVGMPPQMPTQEERTFALLAILLAIPTSFIAPLVFYLIKKDESEFVAFHAMQTLIFQVVVLIGYIISFFLTGLFCIGFLLLPVIGIGSLVYLIFIAIKAYEGEWAEFYMVGEWAKDMMRRS